jgi:hypothetical protein
MSIRRIPLPLPRLQSVSQPQSGKTRVATDQPCELRTDTGTRRAVVFNFSTVGSYLAIDAPLPHAGEEIELSFGLPGRPEAIACTARVAWLNPPSIILGDMGSLATGLPSGCGIEFVRLSEADRARIEAYVTTARRSGPLAGLRSSFSLS